LIVVCVSSTLTYEYVDVLSRKLAAERWATLQPVLVRLLSIAQYTSIYFSWRPTSPDPGDDLAIDFRSAKESLGLRVMTPVEFVNMLATGEFEP
jgi:hypothetical protein